MQQLQHPHWEQSDHNDLASAQTFTDLFQIAKRILLRMKNPVMVSGPITTGGKGSPEANLLFLASSINNLTEAGFDVFNQKVFEDELARIKQIACAGTEYCHLLFDEFYEPILSSGLIKTVYFLPGWQSSTGAKIERGYCETYSIEAKEYPTELLPNS